MSRLSIATSINIDLEFEIAPFHKRLLAWLIDFVLFLVYLFILFRILEKNAAALGDDAYWMFFILMLPIALYHLVTESLMHGQTIGKKILKIKVINETGGNATFSQFVIRWMLRISDLIMMVMILCLAVYGAAILKQFFFVAALAGVDIFCVALSKKAQRIGDMAAGTLLISTKTNNTLSQTIFMEVEDNYVPTYPEVMRLSDRDITMVKNIFDTLQKKDNYQLAERTAEKITNALNITTNQTAKDFLEILLKDYNHLSTK